MTKIVAVATVGLDLGDRNSYFVALDGNGEIVSEGRVATRETALRKFFGAMEPCRVVIEAGAVSGWVSRTLVSLGHEALVANPRQLPLVTRGVKKTDRTDAETLARIGRFDPALLKPIRHRDAERQRDLLTLRSRDKLVGVRRDLVNSVRGMLKQFGIRVVKCSPGAFVKRALGVTPGELRNSLGPALAVIKRLTVQIRGMDREIERLCAEKYPETGVLTQIRGVGPITALAFVLVLETPGRFCVARDAGAYVGLTPRNRQSGGSDPQLGITKAGDRMLRCLLVNCAQYILGPFGIDCDLRRHGDKIRERGGKNAKKRAVVAVARKLAVLMARLWRTGEVWEPLYNESLSRAA